MLSAIALSRRIIRGAQPGYGYDCSLHAAGAMEEFLGQTLSFSQLISKFLYSDTIRSDHDHILQLQILIAICAYQNSYVATDLDCIS